MSFDLKSVLHGVVDPTFASRTAVGVAAPTLEGEWSDEVKATISAARAHISKMLAVEVNRVEGQLSLMLNHLEGTYQSKVANLQIKKIWYPLTIGFIVGFTAATVFWNIVR